MMTDEDFAEQYQRLADNHGRRAQPNQCSVWFETFEELDLPTLRRAVTSWVKNRTKFPEQAELIQAYREAEAVVPGSRVRPLVPSCDYCDRGTFVWVKLEDPSRTHLARCGQCQPDEHHLQRLPLVDPIAIDESDKLDFDWTEKYRIDLKRQGKWSDEIVNPNKTKAFVRGMGYHKQENPAKAAKRKKAIDEASKPRAYKDDTEVFSV